MTEPQLGGTYDDLRWAAVAAEAAGFETFARSDHYYWREGEPVATTEAFTSLAGIARETSRIRLAILVSPVTFRHPSFLAKAAATLDEMSAGRLDLGLGTGWMEAEHEAFGIPFPGWPERFARLGEALGYLRASFGGETFQGQYYRLSAAAYPRPGGIRIIVGGSGPAKTPALAGTFADEYNMFVGPLATMRPRFLAMREAAARAGRDADAITLSLMGPAVIADNQASLTRLLATAAAFRHVAPEELAERWRRAEVPFGTTEQVAETFGQLEAAGIAKYHLQWLDVSDRESISELLRCAARL